MRHMLKLQSKCPKNVPTSPRLNTYCGYISNVSYMLLQWNCWAHSTKALNVLNNVITGFRPPCPQWICLSSWSHDPASSHWGQGPIYPVGTWWVHCGNNTWPQYTQQLKIGYILNFLCNGSTMCAMVKNWAHSECLLPLWPKCAHQLQISPILNDHPNATTMCNPITGWLHSECCHTSWCV